MPNAELVTALPGVPAALLDSHRAAQWGRGAYSGPTALDVYDLDTGTRLRSFPRTSPRRDRDRSQEAVAPDLGAAVLVGDDALRCTDTGGTVRWTYPLGAQHVDIVDAVSVCYSADGRVVWGCLGEPADAPDAPASASADVDEYVALDAATGRVLARTLWTNQSPLQYPHPDGVHILSDHSEWMGAVRLDGDRVVLRHLDTDAELCLVDVAPDGGYLATGSSGAYLLRCRPLDDPRREELPASAELARFEPADHLHEEAYLQHRVGHLDPAHVLIAIEDWDVDDGFISHGVLRFEDLTLLGPVRYPDRRGAAPSRMYPLGDGTWLTADEGTEGVLRWRLA